MFPTPVVNGFKRGFEMDEGSIDAFEIAERRQVMEDVFANAAFEGLRPTPAFQALVDRFVIGEITIDEAISIVNSGRLADG